VAEDHQTKNAMAYVLQEAALILKDAEAVGQMKEEVDRIMNEPDLVKKLSQNIRALAKPNAAGAIVNEIEKLIA
jgi:UDP-N-acetylglucosamine--N-acetylmuramyl-(pentapeptide) pyrophosphoryl-undecaprenol N-acetylglucosamine transferase